MATIYNTDTILENNKTPEERQKDGKAEINDTFDIYAHYTKLFRWTSKIEFETEIHNQNFSTMSLHTFSKIFYEEDKSGGT